MYGTHPAYRFKGTGGAAGPATTDRCLKETPVGVEPTLAGLQPAAWPSGSSVLLVARPGIEPGLRPSHGRVHPTHSQAVVPRQGIEPRLADSKSAVLVRHTRKAQHERKDSNPVRQFWRLTTLPGAHSHGGYPTGIEPAPPASQAGVVPCTPQTP